MTRQRKYYLRKIQGSGERALSHGELGPGAHRGLTVTQALAIGTLALAHLFDFTTFLVLINRHGLSAEANPIVVRIAETAGIPGLTVAKLATVAFAGALMLIIAPRHPKLAIGLFAFGVAAGLIGGLSNVASF